MNTPRTQMIQRQVAGGLKDEGFKVVDGVFGQCTADAQPGFLKQVFGSVLVADHALQGA